MKVVRQENVGNISVIHKKCECFEEGFHYEHVLILNRYLPLTKHLPKQSCDERNPEDSSSQTSDLEATLLQRSFSVRSFSSKHGASNPPCAIVCPYLSSDAQTMWCQNLVILFVKL